MFGVEEASEDGCITLVGERVGQDTFQVRHDIWHTGARRKKIQDLKETRKETTKTRDNSASSVL